MKKIENRITYQLAPVSPTIVQNQLKNVSIKDCLVLAA